MTSGYDQLDISKKMWRKVKLEEIVNIFASNVDKVIDPTETSVRLCNYLDVYNNFYITNNLKFMIGSANEREIKKFSLYKDDVIITKDSETPDDIANAAVVSEDLENIVCGYHLALLRPHKKKVNGTFLMHYLHHPAVNNQFARLANGVTRFGLTINSIKHAKILLPPLNEQRRIAEILGEWDNAITLTGRLIAARQRRKKALMQQLLTGKVRFGGFVGSVWETVRLKEVSEIQYGKSPRDIRNDEGQFLIYGTGGIVGRTDETICNHPAVIIGRKGTIDQPQLVKEPFWAIDTTFYCTPNDRVSVEWIYYALSLIDLAYYNEASGVPSLSRNTLYSIKIPLPPFSEQRRIAAVLQTCDGEIALLEQKLSALKRQKQGLMQQLLSGKVRV